MSGNKRVAQEAKLDSQSPTSPRKQRLLSTELTHQDIYGSSVAGASELSTAAAVPEAEEPQQSVKEKEILEGISTCHSQLVALMSGLEETPTDEALLGLKQQVEDALQQLEFGLTELREKQQVRHQGTVAWFDGKKGYGFLKKTDVAEGESAKDAFVHRRDLVCTGFKAVQSGRRVSFRLIEQDNDKLHAVDVRSPEGLPLANGFLAHTESWTGKKQSLEDRYVCWETLKGLGAYFGVFDGHGGVQCADFVAKNLHRRIVGALRGGREAAPDAGPPTQAEVENALEDGFIQLDKNFIQIASRQSINAGSTAVVALYCGSGPGDLLMYIANLGDSRAVLCRGGKAVRLSEDHKPSRRDERNRIEKAGGIVAQVQGIWRVTREAFTERDRRERVWLAVSRAFGNFRLKDTNPLVINTPEIRVEAVGDDDLFMVMCCDGVWDVMSDQEVIDLAGEHWGDPNEAAAAIVRTALQKGSQDNLTAQVIQYAWQSDHAKDMIAKWLETEAQRKKEVEELEEDIDMFS